MENILKPGTIRLEWFIIIYHSWDRIKDQESTPYCRIGVDTLPHRICTSIKLRVIQLSSISWWSKNQTSQHYTSACTRVINLWLPFSIMSQLRREIQYKVNKSIGFTLRSSIHCLRVTGLPSNPHSQFLKALGDFRWHMDFSEWHQVWLELTLRSKLEYGLTNTQLLTINNLLRLSKRLPWLMIFRG